MIVGLAEFHAATARIDNRAVFEVPELLAGLLHAQPAPPSWSYDGLARSSTVARSAFS